MKGLGLGSCRAPNRITFFPLADEMIFFCYRYIGLLITFYPKIYKERILSKSGVFHQ